MWQLRIWEKKRKAQSSQLKLRFIAINFDSDQSEWMFDEVFPCNYCSRAMPRKTKTPKVYGFSSFRMAEVSTEHSVQNHEMWNKRQKNLWINFLNKHMINSSIFFGMRHGAWGINNALCSSWTETVWEMKIYTFHEGQTNLLLPYATNNRKILLIHTFIH